MNIFYDTEFLEDGRSIGLISIGLVREDGAEYYAVVYGEQWFYAIGKHDWLMENVVPSLPITVQPTPTWGGDIWNYLTWDVKHPDWQNVKPTDVIAHEVRRFIQGTQDPELWAWYAAFDHVALAWLWGPMCDLPEGIPMYTHDLKQECDRLGNPLLPNMTGGIAHNALHDARECKMRYEWLKAHEYGYPPPIWEEQTDA